MHRRSDTMTEDAMIAATAKVHRLTVVTRNAAHGSHPLAGGGHFAAFSNIIGAFGGYFSSPFEEIVDLGENRFKAQKRDGSYTYGPLELYFAGLIPPEDVPDFWVAFDGECTSPERPWTNEWAERTGEVLEGTPDSEWSGLDSWPIT